jgi:hypothetical protein
MIKQRLRFAAHVLKNDQRVARAARSMPKPMPWDWARPRVIPLLSGPRFDDPGEGFVRAQAGPGCAVEFGVDLGGGAFVLVDQIVAERWECSAQQLLQVGLENLDARLSRLTPADVASGAFSGRMMRRLERPRRCAASVILLKDQLLRLFGSHDQVLAAPSQGMLVSFRIDTPPQVVATSVVELELEQPVPLLYEPFVLLDGMLHWQAEDDDEPGYAERARSWPAA